MVVGCLLAFGFDLPEAVAADFKRDPTDALFRRAPMAESSRSIIIPLATNVHLAFDAQLLRAHTVWSGPGLNLRGPPYTGQKSPFLCDFEGSVLWSNPPIFPWSAGVKEDLNERPRGARFEGIRTKGTQVTLIYKLALPNGNTVRIQESPALRQIGDVKMVVRQFEIGPSAEEMRFLAHVESGQVPGGRIGASGIVLERKSDVLLAVAHSDANVAWDYFDGLVHYVSDVLAENKFDSEIRSRRITGNEGRCYLHVPAHTGDITIEIFSAVCTAKVDAERMERTLTKGSRSPAEAA